MQMLDFETLAFHFFIYFLYANYQQEIQQQQAVVSSSQLGNQNSGAIPPPHSQSPSHPYRSINEKINKTLNRNCIERIYEPF